MADDIDINVLMAMNWCKYAWDSVPDTSIRYCFIEAHFKREQQNSTQIEVVLDINSELEIVSSLIDQIGGDIDANEYVNIDDELITNDPDAEKESDDQAIDINISDEEDSDKMVDPPSAKEAIEAMEILSRFYYSENFMTQIEFDKVQTSFMSKIAQLKRQTLITDHFQKK